MTIQNIETETIYINKKKSSCKKWKHKKLPPTSLHTWEVK